MKFLGNMRYILWKLKVKLLNRWLKQLLELKIKSSDKALSLSIGLETQKTVELLEVEHPFLSERQLVYSQEGEDLILKRIFGAQSKGFFIDVGAYHPVRFSNTFLLYQQGWQGINIDATPGSMVSFKEMRPKDINLEFFVAEDEGDTTFFMFNEPALNTSSAELAAEREKLGDSYKIIKQVKVKKRLFKSILDQYLPKNQGIDLLNIDVENAEMGVLKSNDWTKYRPRFILVEQLATTFEAVFNHQTTQFLNSIGYKPCIKTYNTVFFSRDSN